MKHLLTIISCFAVLSMSAQNNLIEFPYNPDSDNDDLIGTADLLDLLSLFGSEFSEEGLYLNEDSTDSLYFTGDMYYGECRASCNSLPGNWVFPHYDDFFEVDINSLEQSLAWVHPDAPGYPVMSTGNNFKAVFVGYETIYDNGRLVEVDMYQTRSCYCYLHERPKIEYFTCTASCSDGIGALDICVNQKTEEGWYLLNSSLQQVYSTCYWQPLWRFIE